ncbi:MAG: Tetratricopeptide repeat protein, partial [Planctomycetaceae bacterium]|nr:Tetratricopeptide repeat protein [Planctomycetaceae bacterium]
GAGFLAVCFGTVITANSPASQAAHPTCWESTLWHEFCHVVTLNKTHNRMPRWLSEGISVYEERQANPSWGQAMSPGSRKMLLGDELTPVDQLSGAFLRPPSPQHLQFAYYESSLVVEYLVEKHGLEILKKILNDLGQGLTINDALARHTGSLEELNHGFAEFARQKANAMAPEADWSEPELPRRADATQAMAWLKEHPKNYPGLQRLARQLIASKQWEAAKQPLEAMRKLYPEDKADDSLYPLLAQVHRELKETPQERAALERLTELSDDNVEAFSRLAQLTALTGEWELSRKYAQSWLAVNPLLPAPHRLAAAAAEKLKDETLAVDSYQAILLLNPVDTADLHLKLATAFQRKGDLLTAKRHALLAAEEAPRFRAAHRQLLAILKQAGVADEPAISVDLDRPSAPALPETLHPEASQSKPIPPRKPKIEVKR